MFRWHIALSSSGSTHCSFLKSRVKVINVSFWCDIPVAFYKLNTKYINISQNTTKFIVLCCTICYKTTCFGPLFRPSSGCVRLALRLMYPVGKYTTLMMRCQSSYNFSLIMAGVQADQYEWAQAQGVGWQGWNNVCILFSCVYSREWLYPFLLNCLHTRHNKAEVIR